MYIQKPQKKIEMRSFLSVEAKNCFGETLYGIHTRTFYHGATAPSGSGPSHCVGSKITDTILRKTPLDE
jgi:hypothetical protein